MLRLASVFYYKSKFFVGISYMMHQGQGEYKNHITDVLTQTDLLPYNNETNIWSFPKFPKHRRYGYTQWWLSQNLGEYHIHVKGDLVILCT